RAARRARSPRRSPPPIKPSRRSSERSRPPHRSSTVRKEPLNEVLSLRSPFLLGRNRRRVRAQGAAAGSRSDGARRDLAAPLSVDPLARGDTAQALSPLRVRVHVHHIADPEAVRGCRPARRRSEEHTSELQSRENLVCRLLLEKKKCV